MSLVLDKDLLNYGVSEESFEKEFAGCSDRLHKIFTMLVFNLNQLRPGTVCLIEIDAPNQCRVAWKHGPVQKKEKYLEALISASFGDQYLNDISCRWGDDGRGYHFVLKCSEEFGNKIESRETPK